MQRDPHFMEYLPTGRLFVERQGCSMSSTNDDAGLVLQVRSWEEGCGVLVWGAEGWVEDDSALPGRLLPVDVDALDQDHPLRLFAATIPQEVRDLVQQFPTRQVRLLKILRSQPETLTWAVTHPTLFWLAAGMLDDSASVESVCEQFPRSMCRACYWIFGLKAELGALLVHKLQRFPFTDAAERLLHQLVLSPGVDEALNLLPWLDWDDACALWRSCAGYSSGGVSPPARSATPVAEDFVYNCINIAASSRRLSRSQSGSSTSAAAPIPSTQRLTSCRPEVCISSTMSPLSSSVMHWDGLQVRSLM